MAVLPQKDALVITAKYPSPGAVKTRLARQLGFGLAAEIYRAFLRDLDTKFTQTFPPVYWAYTPEGSPFPDFLGPRRNYLVQKGENLGERMFNLFRLLLEQGHEKVVLIGSDLPHLSPQLIEAAFDKLKEHDVVLGPAGDGGYYLIGMRKAHEMFSNVAWSTPLVLAQTLAKVAEQGLSVHLLPETFDVDGPEDVEKLRTVLSTGREQLEMRHTTQALARFRAADGTLVRSRIGKYFNLTSEQVALEEQECLKVLPQEGFGDSLKTHVALVARVAAVLVARLREDLGIPLSEIAVAAARYHDAYRSDDRSRRLRPFGTGPKGFSMPHDGHEVRLGFALRKTEAKTMARIVRNHNVLRPLYPVERTIDENVLLIADAMVEEGKIVPVSVRRDAIIKRHALGSPEGAHAYEIAYDVVERILEMYFDAGLDRLRFFKQLGL